MKKILYLSISLIVLVLFYASTFVFSYSQLWRNRNPLLRNDVARLYPTMVDRVETLNAIEDLQRVVTEAHEKGWNVSIAGSKHSQGGHTYYPGAVVLDMSAFNQVLSLDQETKIIRVQSGAKWDDIQRYINPYDLAVKVMQSSNIFTIGGTLSADAHGRDLEQGSVVETVRSFRLLTANGDILNVSREEHPDLFKLVIGGYGLFGVILDVDLQLTDNDVYLQKSVIMDYVEFPDYFTNHIQGHDEIKMMLVRPSIAEASFLRELVVTTWSVSDQSQENIDMLTEEKNVLRDKFFFGLSRKFDWAKDLRWDLQKNIELGIGEDRVMTRNNAMRPPLAPLEFLDYYSSTNTDILQEYFIPTRNFVSFMDEFRKLLLEHDLNVISFTIRYVKANDETYLAYAPHEDVFAIIHMSNVGLSEEAQKETEQVTQSIVDAAIQHGGTYYLTYQLYPTNVQMRNAYPQADLFFQKKLEYDPQETFINKFYEKYAH